ncbi:MAG: uracil-DNA glycosylase [Rhizobiaceae bacterium]
MMAFDVPPAWRSTLEAVFSTPRSHHLAGVIASQEAQGRLVHPQPADRFLALQLTSPENVRVVILGQDPYHGPGQAHGLAFSVPHGVAVPPSLRNIYKELSRELGLAQPASGNLEHWARQGVLLLNTVLTVEEGKAGSHQGLGWEEITDAVIQHLGERTKPTVFMLWGAHAQKKRSLITNPSHLILEAPHPSPLSAHRGFLGCGHFGKANAFLGARRIDW